MKAPKVLDTLKKWSEDRSCHFSYEFAKEDLQRLAKYIRYLERKANKQPQGRRRKVPKGDWFNDMEARVEKLEQEVKLSTTKVKR